MALRLVLHLVGSTCTPLLLDCKILSFWIVSDVRLRPTVVKKSLVTTSVINSVVDVLIRRNCIHNWLRIRISYDSITPSNIVLRGHYIIINVAQHLVDFVHILFLHLSV